MIESIFINKTELSPKVYLDKEHNKFLITGKSIVENSHDFYFPIFSWFKEYFMSPNDHTELVIYLQYINSSSFLQISNLAELFSRNNDKQVSFTWLYDKDDESMLEIGKDLEDTHSLTFKFVELFDEQYKNSLINI